MNRRLPRSLAAAALTLAGVGAAHGFTLKETPAGQRIRWAASEVTFYIARAGARDLPLSKVIRAVQASFYPWTQVPGTAIALTYRGPTDAPAGLAQHGSNENVVAFSRDGWAFEPDALAMTVTAYKQDSGQLVDADILVNESQYTWGLGADAENDLQNALTHEVGHFLGLAHSDQATATMFARAEPWETDKRTLDADDMAGLLRLYPGETPAAATPPATATKADEATAAPTAAQQAAQRTAPPIRIKTGCDQSGQSAAGGLWPLVLLGLGSRRRRR